MEQRKMTGRTKTVVRKEYLLVSLVVGLIIGATNVFLYSVLKHTIPGPILFALLVTLFALTIGMTVFAMARLGEGRGRSRNISDTFGDLLDGNGWLFMGMVAALVVLFLSGGLFEWLYEIEVREAAQPSSYIFVLDESSSMDALDKDPDSQRYTAVSNVMQAEDQKVPYAVYIFTESCIRIRDMEPYGGEVLQKSNVANMLADGTSIVNALNTVANDLSNGNIQGGDYPHIILLTDGESDAVEKAFLKDCRNKGISISGIMLGNADEGYLGRIVYATGGLLVAVNDAEELTAGFYELAVKANERDLLSIRRNISGDWLYVILRLVMLTVIGAMIAIIKLIALGDDWHVESLIASVVCAFVGAMIVEFVLRGGISTPLCQWFFWMLLAPMYWTLDYVSQGERDLQSEYLSNAKEDTVWGLADSFMNIFSGRGKKKTGAKSGKGRQGGGNKFDTF